MWPIELMRPDAGKCPECGCGDVERIGRRSGSYRYACLEGHQFEVPKPEGPTATQRRSASRLRVRSRRLVRTSFAAASHRQQRRRRGSVAFLTHGKRSTMETARNIAEIAIGLVFAVGAAFSATYT